jgi:NitT/TauT family transport system substrate-binding protein
MITRRALLATTLAAAASAPVGRAGAVAAAAAPLRLGVLKFGTVSWELDTIAHHGFDAKHGVALDIRLFAGEDATNVALQAGAIDVIVTDWLWVSRQRAQGGDLTLSPYSTAVGAVMVPAASPIAALADLRGKKLGVAGGPLDKSWLLIQALAGRDGGADLAAENDVAYGAPPLIAEKLAEGEFDAALNFWHFCARQEADGFRRLIGANDAARALGASGDVSALGYVFHDSLPADNPAAIRGFLRASADAKALLLASDAEWQRLAPLVRAEGAELAKLRDRYREGIPRRPVEAEAADAARLYAVLAKIGGAKLVGQAEAMAPGTFWEGAE